MITYKKCLNCVNCLCICTIDATITFRCGQKHNITRNTTDTDTTTTPQYKQKHNITRNTTIPDLGFA